MADHVFTFEDYLSMTPEHIRAFDAWLKRSNLMSRNVVRIEFDDLVFTKPKLSAIQVVTIRPTQSGMYVSMGRRASEHQLTVVVDTPLPRFIVQYCGGGTGGNGSAGRAPHDG